MRGDGRLVDPAKMLPSNGTGEVGGHARDRGEMMAMSMVLPRKRGEHSQRYIEEAPVLVQRGRKTGGGRRRQISPAAEVVDGERKR
jgi:hypothetical protein